MSTPAPADSAPLEEEQNNEKNDAEPPAHNPSAPLHEAFDISTAVDPCYIISLIRKLLPSKHGDHTFKDATEKEEMAVGNTLENQRALPDPGHTHKFMSNAEGLDEVDVSAAYNDVHLPDKHHNAVVQATWEECGCTLWDLAASESNAQFMMENFILEVLQATLMVSNSARIKEISLGIIGNLACHEVTRKQIFGKSQLIETIVDQLFLDDVPCLCEAFRLLTFYVQFDDIITWMEALKPEHILSRVLWIAENALNVQLIEKSVGFILAILSGSLEIGNFLLLSLMKLGLPRLLINLLDFEMKKLKQERTYERCSVLDKVLETIEFLYEYPEFGAHISVKEELFKLVNDLIKFPNKSEISTACTIAADLVDAILCLRTDLISEVSQDMDFLRGLLNILPFASDDIGAKVALWSTIDKLLRSIGGSKISTVGIHRCVSVLVSTSGSIEEALLEYDSDEEGDKWDRNDIRLGARNVGLAAIADTLREWKVLKASGEVIASSKDNYVVNEEDVDKLLQRCRKYVK